MSVLLAVGLELLIGIYRFDCYGYRIVLWKYHFI